MNSESACVSSGSAMARRLLTGRVAGMVATVLDSCLSLEVNSNARVENPRDFICEAEISLQVRLNQHVNEAVGDGGHEGGAGDGQDPRHDDALAPDPSH